MKIKRFIPILLLFLVLTLFIIIPVINIRLYPFSAITSKFIVFIYAILLIGSFYTLKTVTSQANRVQLFISKLDIAVIVTLAFIIVNRYFIQEDYNFSIRFFELMGLGILYFVLRGFRLKNYIYIFMVIVISGVIQAIYGWLQYLGFYHSNHAIFDITGSFFNPGPYSGFIAVTGVIALGLYLFKEQLTKSLNSKHKYLNICNHFILTYITLLGIIGTLFILSLTESRASYLSFFISGILLIELKHSFIRRLFFKNKKVFTFFLAVGTLLLILGLYNLKPASADGRFLIWKISTSIISDNLFFGVGFDRFTAYYMNYQADYFALNKNIPEIMVAGDVYYAYNEFLQFFIENGLIGFVLLFTTIIILFKTKTTAQNTYVLSVVKIGIIALIIFACFSYPTHILPLKLVGLVLFCTLSKLDTNIKKKTISFEPIYRKYIISGILILITAFGLFLGINKIKIINDGFLKWRRIANAGIFQDYEMNAREYKTLQPIFNKNGVFLYVYGKTLSRANQNKEALNILLEAEKYYNDSKLQLSLAKTYKSLQHYKNAEQSYKNATFMVPAKINPQYQLAKLYIENNDTLKALLIAKEIVNKDLKIPSDKATEIKNEMQMFIDSK